MLTTETRFCIIGAGAGGISAAWYLRKRGYRHITILEKAPRIGGKCHALTHDGVTIDLGATAIMPGYRHIRQVAREVGATFQPVGDVLTVRQTGNATGDGMLFRSVADLILEKHTRWDFIRATGRFIAAHRRHAAVLRRPGFAGMSARGRDADLALPFGDWVDGRGMAPLLILFHLVFTLFGYGDAARLPAAYVLRYITARHFLDMMLTQVQKAWGAAWPLRFTEGFDGFLHRMAAGFDIRTGATIESIDRGDTVSVAWSEAGEGRAVQRHETFDRLIIAFPPDTTKDVMAWSAEEARLFPLIRTAPYAVTACESTGIPAGVSFVETPGGAGHLMLVWKPAPGPSVCALYTAPAPGMTVDDITVRARDDLRRLYPDATLGRVIEHAHWVYFPRVEADVFAAGFYDDLEALQGAHHTWYCGGLPAFEMTESIFAYSKAMVSRMEVFPRA